MNINEILSVVIKSDYAMRGFVDPEKLPFAARARVKDIMVRFESRLDSNGLLSLKMWAGVFHNEWRAIAELGNEYCRYFVFRDGSLYFRSNGDSEVWASAEDFALERIIPIDRKRWDETDVSLLKFLGGVYADSAKES
jgi:hypothetical protein